MPTDRQDEEGSSTSMDMTVTTPPPCRRARRRSGLRAAAARLPLRVRCCRSGRLLESSGGPAGRPCVRQRQGPAERRDRGHRGHRRVLRCEDRGLRPARDRDGWRSSDPAPRRWRSVTQGEDLTAPAGGGCRRARPGRRRRGRRAGQDLTEAQAASSIEANATGEPAPEQESSEEVRGSAREPLRGHGGPRAAGGGRVRRRLEGMHRPDPAGAGRGAVQRRGRGPGDGVAAAVRPRPAA